MASALISVTGTSGSVNIRYKIGIVNHSLVADISDIYIEDTATDITYTTISGNAIASSLVLTIIALPYKYYDIAWKGLRSDGYKIKTILLGEITYAIPEVSFPESTTLFINNVNSLNNDVLKITDFKNTGVSVLGNTTPNNSYIIRILGNEIPTLEIRNSDNTGNIYIKGVLVAYPVIGYTSIQLCDSIVAL